MATGGGLRIGFQSGPKILQISRNLVNARGVRLNPNQPAIHAYQFPIAELPVPIATPAVSIVWNKAGSPQLKWNPGHYMGSAVRTNASNSNLSQKQNEITQMLASGVNVLGWMGKYQWPALQSTSATSYNFSFIDTDYTQVTGMSSPSSTPTGKRMIIQIMADTFSNSPGAILPAFILNNSSYGAGANGTQFGYWTFNGGSDVVCALWRSSVMNAMIALWQALAAHILPSGNTVDQDPYIEQIMTWEIASPTGADAGGGFTVSSYLTQLENLVGAANTAFTKTVCIAESNYCNDAASTATLVSYLQAHRWGGGGPDTFGYTWLKGISPYNGSLNKLTWGQQVFTGVATPTYPSGNPSLQGLMPWSNEIQDPELVGFSGQFAAAPWMPQDCMDTVTNIMSLPSNRGGQTHFIWQYIGGSGAANQDPTTYKNTSTSPGNWHDQVLPVINANPIPYTGYPTNLP